MSGSDHSLPVRLLHVTEDVYTRPSTHQIFLGIVCDTDRWRFELSETKLEQAETLRKEAIQSCFIMFHDLEKLAGNCTSMSNAVPPSSLYMYHMHKKISQHQKAGYSSIRIPVAPNSGLCSKMELYLDVCSRINGASWYDAAHHPLRPRGHKRILLELGRNGTRNSWLR